MAINIPIIAATSTLSLAVVRMVEVMISSLDSLAGDGLEWRDAAGGWRFGAS